MIRGGGGVGQFAQAMLKRRCTGGKSQIGGQPRPSSSTNPRSPKSLAIYMGDETGRPWQRKVLLTSSRVRCDATALT